MATATRPRRSKIEAVQAATPAQLQAVLQDIKLREREAEKRTLGLNALAGKNLCQIGPPGTGKSMLTREFCKRIGVGDDELRHFEKILHPQMPADALLGAYDMEKLLSESKLERKVEGYMPSAHSSFLDEIGRANGPVTDAMLPILNTTERLYEADGHMVRAETLFMVFATNFLPDANDPQFGAFVSRITLMCHVDYIKSDDNFIQMLREDQARKRGEPGMEPQERIALQEFIGAQREVRNVDLTSGDFPQEYAQLRRACRAAGLGVDDRQWAELADVARAAAWLAGRDFCTPEDLCALEPGLWKVLAELPQVLTLLLPYRSTFEQDAAKFREEAQEAFDTHARLRPVIEANPGSQLDQDTVREMTNGGRALRLVYKRTREALAKAESQQRDAPGLRDLLTELLEWRDWRDANDLRSDWDH